VSKRGATLTPVSTKTTSKTTRFLVLFGATVLMARLVSLMLGPLLVVLADEFNTSVAVAGQLAAATFVTWGITAPLVGPFSDTYGRRPALLHLQVPYRHTRVPRRTGTACKSGDGSRFGPDGRMPRWGGRLPISLSPTTILTLGAALARRVKSTRAGTASCKDHEIVHAPRSPRAVGSRV